MNLNKIEIQDSVIYFDDSRFMDKVENESVHLIVTSPPYFNYIEYGKTGIGTEDKYPDYLENIKKVLTECMRVLIPGGTVCINISNMKSRKSVEGKSFLYPIISDYTQMMNKIGFIFFDEIVWVKADANNGALGGKMLFGSYPYPPTPKILDSIFENILIFKKEGKLKNRFTKEIKQNSKVTKEEWLKFTKGIWTFRPDKKSDHPASFPVELPKRLIKIYSFIGETVLDPFAGTGSTAVASNLLGRKSIGYEIYDEYNKFIKEKFSEAFDQLSIFKEEQITSPF